MADERLPAPPEPPAYDFRTDPTLLARGRTIAASLLAGQRIMHGDEHTLARALIVLDEKEDLRAKETLAAPCHLLVVEGAVERRLLQEMLDPTTRRIHVTTAMEHHAVIGRRYAAIFLRYPSIAWFEAKKVETHEFQAWERQHLYPRLIRGGLYQHI
ncbi:hypothetical protein HOT99_gp059 [Caulobacter phage CcrBL10]|uniref:Uncharacterized protein n=1 Tax=Caulobacter phage CcrBL10 TaxID=2283269 RepID=A0A385E8X8_9CAUD|nr:hypothetical protein HOT99_gp059 [Caulobacter phage CcrBL10]AXQ68263.1 hypothetical protein CcrBL10_gp059 [Caulobacter phage CcrBL10]